MGLTYEQIRARVAEIEDCLDDPEVAHSIEDALYIDFVQWVAESSTDPLARVHAQRVLETLKLDFTRWYA